MSSSTSEGVVSELLAKVGELSSRVAVLEHDLRQLRAPVVPPPKVKQRRNWSEEQRETQRQRMLQIRANERARKAAQP